KALYVPQPTVSNRIQYLEEEFGQQLFIRGKRGVTLTKAGKILLPLAQEIVDKVSMAMSLLNSSIRDNNFKIGSTIPFTYPLIWERINKLSTRYHDLNITLLLLNFDQAYITDKLVNKEIDTAFVVDPINRKGIESHRIGKEEMQLILSPEHHLVEKEDPIELKDLENENLICYEPYFDSLSPNILINTNHSGRLLTNQIGLVKQFLIQKQGVAFLPPFTLKNEIKKGELIAKEIKKDVYVNPIEYYLVCRTNERYYDD